LLAGHSRAIRGPFAGHSRIWIWIGSDRIGDPSANGARTARERPADGPRTIVPAKPGLALGLLIRLA
jgi:hypothetical protein